MKRALLLMSCFAALAPDLALARDFGTCCGDTVRWFRDPTFKLLPISFLDGSAAKARFVEAARAYSNVTGSWLDWTVTMDNDNQRTERGDGTEVGFFDVAPDWGVLAETLVKWGACPWPACDEEISEADIKFYNRDRGGAELPWNFSIPSGAYFQRLPAGIADPNGDPAHAPSEPLYFAIVASHEIGHASGLTHTSHGGRRMESHYPSGGWFHRGGARFTPLANDQSELRRIYPTSGSSADVYLISWQDINYSTNPNGGIDSWPVTAQEVPNGDAYYYPYNHTRTLGNDDAAARAGDAVFARLCAGNLGNEDAVISGLEFFLSRDQDVETADIRTPERWLANRNVRASEEFCGNWYFTIPQGTAPGWYYVGAWLNRGGSTGTANSNNATILNRRVRVVN